tara:strand:+ start:1560 stop:1778 length:219 start_codon:yes stop_codon:yes gene_type:complete
MRAEGAVLSCTKTMNIMAAAKSELNVAVLLEWEFSGVLKRGMVRTERFGEVGKQGGDLHEVVDGHVDVEEGF